MVRIRPPSSTHSTGGLPSGDAPEHGSNRHSESGEITLAQDIACHDLAGREDVPDALYRGPLVHFYAEISEGNAGAQRITEKRWCINGQRPVRFRWSEAGGVAIVERLRIEFARKHRAVIVGDGAGEFVRREAKRGGQACDALTLKRREHRRHEF